MKEVFISVDVETSGPIPEEYGMLSIGACVVGDASKRFYAELKPLNDNYLQEYIAVCGFNMDELKINGVDPAKAMRNFERWVREAAGYNRPVFVAFNATFDWMFVQYYLHRFLGRSPFGFSGLDIKAYYMGMAGCAWSETTKSKLDKQFLVDIPHTHNALDDAIEQAEIFQKLLQKNKSLR